MSEFYQALFDLTGIPPEIMRKIASTLLIILLLWILRVIVVRIIWRVTEDVRSRYQGKRTTTYLTIVLFLILFAAVWIKEFKTIGTFLGLLSAGIAIALKDPLTNIVGWLFILARKPFKVGDRIQIERIAGDVIDIHIFRFTILEIGNWVDADQTTGRVIHVPNGKVFIESLANYHTGFNYIWNEIPVLITFESNWEKAKDILLSIVNQHAERISAEMERELKEASKKFMIHYKILTPIVYTSVKDYGVELTMRYLVKPRNRRGSVQTMWEEILQQFAASKDIDFAYPTQRFYNNVAEGKPEARAKKGEG